MYQVGDNISFGWEDSPCGGGGGGGSIIPNDPWEPPYPQLPGEDPSAPHGGGGGSSWGQPGEPHGNDPISRVNACFGREWRANQDAVYGVLGSASTFFGTMFLGYLANRITNTTSSMAMAWGQSLSPRPYGLLNPVSVSPAVAGRLWGTSLTGVRALGILGYNSAQGFAILYLFKGGVAVGSAAVAFDACRK